MKFKISFDPYTGIFPEIAKYVGIDRINPGSFGSPMEILDLNEEEKDFLIEYLQISNVKHSVFNIY